MFIFYANLFFKRLRVFLAKSLDEFVIKYLRGDNTVPSKAAVLFSFSLRHLVDTL